MIITNNTKERKKYVNQLLPFQKDDFYEILKAHFQDEYEKVSNIIRLLINR